MSTTPAFTNTPNISWNANNITSANTAMDGTGTTELIFTAGASGSLLDYIKIKARGTNVATVMSIFLNNGSTTATAANNILLEEVTLPATTASNTASLVSSMANLRNIPLEAGYRIYVAIRTAVAAGFSVTAVGADY